MRKKSRVAAAVLFIMISCSLLGVTAAAGQTERMPGVGKSDTGEETVGTDSPDTAEGMPGMDNQGAAAEATPGTDNQGTMAGEPDEDSTDTAAEMPGLDNQGEAETPNVNSTDAEEAENKETDVLSLQIPQKLGIVIDPWEMDGKGQIYSEQYIIRNTGEGTGILTLSFLCRRGDNSTAIIIDDKAGLHEDENKSIYIELVIGDTNRLAFSEEGVEYQTELAPGEELTVSFAGEVNENASESWGSSDVEVEGVYSWSAAEDTAAETDADATEAEPDIEEGIMDGIEDKPSVSGNDLLGSDMAEGTEIPKEEAAANGSNGKEDSLSSEDTQGRTEPRAEEPSEVLTEDGKETPEQKREDEDITGTVSQETGQNPERDNAEEGQEG